MSIINSSWFSIRNNTGVSYNNSDGNCVINSVLKSEEDSNNCEYIFEVDSDNILKNIELLEKRVIMCESTNKNILESLNNLSKSIEEMEKRDKELKMEIEKIGERLKINETSCNSIKNENLKLINRILEAEISVERTTNILLRKHISFPFTPLSNKFNL